MDRWTLRFKKLQPDAQAPLKSHPGDLGFDLFSTINLVIAPHQRGMVKTGIAVGFPENVGGILKDRSGLASKLGLHVLAGVIDSTYTGEIIVVMLNTGMVPVQIDKGDKVAQLLILPVFQVSNLIEVEDLGTTDRGADGFGSTGK